MKAFLIFYLQLALLCAQSVANRDAEYVSTSESIEAIDLSEVISREGERFYFNEIGGSHRVFGQVIFAEGIVKHAQLLPEGGLSLELDATVHFFTTGEIFAETLPTETEKKRGSSLGIKTKGNSIFIRVNAEPLSEDRKIPVPFSLKHNIPLIFKAVERSAQVKLGCVQTIKFAFASSGDLLGIEVDDIQIIPSDIVGWFVQDVEDYLKNNPAMTGRLSCAEFREKLKKIKSGASVADIYSLLGKPDEDKIVLPREALLAKNENNGFRKLSYFIAGKGDSRDGPFIEIRLNRNGNGIQRMALIVDK